MKLRDIPQSGRDDASVYCYRAGTLYVRVYVKPADPKTDHQRRVRDIMTSAGKRFGTWLTEPERQAWNEAAERINSRPRLGRSGPLTGSVLFAKLNCPRALIGRAWLRLPTGPAVFGPSPVGALTMRREPGRWRLELAVSGPVTDDIMVFATPPCPATWTKCRKPRFLGLLPAPVNGVCDITALYLERFGEPAPGRRIFIRTVPQRDGWEGAPVETNNLVPAKEVCAVVEMGEAGGDEGEPRTLNIEHGTLNQAEVGARRLGLGASLELGVWCLDPFRNPHSEFRIGPCPWDVHAVHTVCGRWLAVRHREVRSGIPPPVGRRRGWQPCLYTANRRRSH